jgi:hypothetical protein
VEETHHLLEQVRSHQLVVDREECWSEERPTTQETLEDRAEAERLEQGQERATLVDFLQLKVMQVAHKATPFKVAQEAAQEE